MKYRQDIDVYKDMLYIVIIFKLGYLLLIIFKIILELFCSRKKYWNMGWYYSVRPNY